MKRAPHSHARRAARIVAPALGLSLLAPGHALASSFSGRILAGPSYMRTLTEQPRSNSSGPALAAQLDAGLRLLEPLVLHGSLIYDYSRWLGFDSGINRNHVGSMLGFGLGARVDLEGLSLGALVGGQFSFFPENNDPSSGPAGAGLGPLVSASAGYVWDALGARLGVHGLARYRRSPDETAGFVYDPSGYQLGLAMSIGLDGKPLY